MRLNFILIFLLVALGAGLSVLLIPREKDVALLKLRSDATDEARQVLLDQYDRGDRSVAVIASLAEIAIADGHIPTAIQLLEDYVARNPKDNAARRRLAEYYRYDQRREDYVATLGEVVALDGTPQERRLLINLYRLRGEYAFLVDALSDVVARGEARLEDFVELTRLAASLGQYQQALAATEQMWRRRPASFNAATVRLYVLVAAAAGKPELAEKTIEQLASGAEGAAAVVPVIRAVADRDQAALGLRLLRRFEGELHQTPPLLVAWARMQESLDQELVALAKLRGLETQGLLPDLAVPVLIDLALLEADVDLIGQIMAKRDFALLTDTRLRAVTDLAVFWRREDLLDQFMKQAAERTGPAEPALLAEVLIALGRQEEARPHVERARAAPNRRLDQLVRLARAEIRLGEEEAAGRTMERIARASELNDNAMRLLAQLFVQTERSRQGLAVFERLRRERPSLAADAGWARMAAAEGQDAALKAWLDSVQGLDKDLLSDIVYLASPGRAPISAMTAAERLFRYHPDRESRRLYGDALLSAGRVEEALTVLQELLPGSDAEAETWVAALIAAGRSDDAFEFLNQRRVDGALPARLADDFIYLALAAGDPEAAYTELERQQIGQLPADVIAAVLERAAEDNAMDRVQPILAGIDERFMASRPVLAARIELARGDRDAARRWAEAAAGRADLQNAEAVTLAGVFADLGEADRALDLLAALAADPSTPGFALSNLATQYLALGKAKEGLATFRRLKEQRSDPEVAEAWARIETVAGEPSRVLAWLPGQPKISRQALTDLYYMAVERPAAELALAASDRLHRDYPDTDTIRIRADALLASGNPAEALPMIERLLPGDDALAELYVSALTAVRRPGDALQFLVDRAGGGAQPLRLADDLIGLAFDRGRPELAFAEAERHKLADLPEQTLTALAGNAANDQRFELFDRIVAELGDDFLRDRPVLAASLAIARGEEAVARDWADKAFGRGGRTNDETIQLANVFLRLGDTERALTLLASVADDPATPAQALADLGNAYLTMGRAREGLAVFRRLIGTRPASQVMEAWARLETAEGEIDRVRDWLKRADRVTAQALADIHYLAVERRADKLAFEAGERYYNVYPGPESRRIHATTLVARGRAEDAVPILEELLPGDDEIAEAYVGALSAVDRKQDALTFLIRRGNGEALPVRIADDYMALAIELDQPKLAYDEARRHNLSRFDGDTIASLAENAAEDGDLELIDQIVDQTEAVFWEARPVMAARIELASGNRDAARRWAEQARAADGLPNAEKLRLARVYSELGEIETSLALLEDLADDPDTPAFAMADLAAQYLQLGKERRGLPVMRRLVERRQEPMVLEGWARIETRAGDPKRVLAWLKPTEPSRQALLDIYYLAAERPDTDLALEASRQLILRYPGREASLIRGQALVAAKRGNEAIPLLRPLLPGTREVRAAYVSALGQVGDTDDLKAFAQEVLDDPDLEPEIRSSLLYGLLEAGAGEIALPALRELAKRDPATWEAAYMDALRQAGATEERAQLIEARLKGRLSRERRDQLLFELLDVGGPERALPWLKRAAEQDPAGTWPATYETALSDLGRRSELIAWLTTRAALPGLPATTRREIGFRLLDLDAKREAEDVFLQLAASAGPKSNDVQQLLYLWGPKPPERGIDWLTSRARSASASDLPGWLTLLADIRAYEEVVALGSEPPMLSARDPRLTPVIGALLQTGRRAEVGQIVDSLIPETDNPDDLLKLADWAEQAERNRTAVAAYERAMQFIGDDPEKLLRAGRAFSFGGRPELAVETLERYFRVVEDPEADHRPWYYYAQSLSQMERQPEARAAYRRMLDVADRTEAADFESRRMRATAFEAIGDSEEAVGLYQQLLSERPKDRSLVADFAALLIELRRYEQAELLLSQN